jgi:hypothetical protein
VSDEVYLIALGRLPEDYSDRTNVAAVAGHLARYGRNVSVIAREMKRTRWWVRQRIAAAELLFEQLLKTVGPHDPEEDDDGEE